MSLLVAPLMVLWPAAAVAALGDGRRRPVGWAVAGVLAVAVALLGALVVRVAADGPVEVVAGGWPADVGIRLRADALGVTLALVSVAVVLAALVHGTNQGAQTHRARAGADDRAVLRRRHGRGAAAIVL